MLAVKPQNSIDLEKLFACLEGRAHVALAVSGGSDSVAMLHLVYDWVLAQGSKPVITVLSVDHALRASSAEECDQVAEWCRLLDVHHVTLKWQGEKPSTGIQAKARQARYDLMVDWCLANAVSTLLTAHTADDQAETVVMRQARTQSAQSLAGIWPERDWNSVAVLRPLLSLRREELRDYLRHRGLVWIDDPSNVDHRFERVRIREQLNGNVGAAGIAVLAQMQVRDAATEAGDWIEANLVCDVTGLLHVPAKPSWGSAFAVSDMVLSEVFKLCGVSKMPEAKKRRSLLAWLAGPALGRRTLGGVVFVKRNHEILIAREPGRISKERVFIPASGKAVWDGRFLIVGKTGAEVVKAGDLSQIPRRRDIPAFVDQGLPVICQDGEVLSAPYHGLGRGFMSEFIRFNHKLRTWNYKARTLC